MEQKKIALFASGSGTNVQNIIAYFSDNQQVKVDSVWTNNPNAYVLQRAAYFAVPSFVFTRQMFNETYEVVDLLVKRGIDLVVLAGFLWLVPASLFEKITVINIHPALLPKYGGKGMYGMNVHNAVVENGDTESGITIHYVNEKYDEGEVIFQAKCQVLSTDTPEDVAQKIHNLEYDHFPAIIEKIVASL